jgi:hypothetical protein
MMAFLIFEGFHSTSAAPALTAAVAEQPVIGSDNVLITDDRARDVIEQPRAVAQKPALAIAGEFEMQNCVAVPHLAQGFVDHGVEPVEPAHPPIVRTSGRPHDDEASAGSILMPHDPHTMDAVGLAQHARPQNPHANFVLERRERSFRQSIGVVVKVVGSTGLAPAGGS